jgi:hypothetical protein
MKVNVGKNTLGDSNKMSVSLRDYGRSTHNLNYAWRSTMGVGSLVPFMKVLALPGDTLNIQLDSKIMTHPTIGPLFGSFKFQADLFTCPIRLYNAMLHNNALGVGLDMKKVKLPKLQTTNEGHTGSSSIWNYLGIKYIKANANVLKENKELLAFQNKINQLKEKVKMSMETEAYTDDGKNKSSWSKEYGFEDIIIQQETKKLLTDFMKMDKEYSEALKDRDIAVRLYNDIDKVIQGKLDELSITDKNLKLLETKLDRDNYELKNDKALGDILNDLGGDSKYSKLLKSVINWFMRK